ncbi:hypothetical protein [Actinomadura opuntiae]|uniref:hypothetical protein n=1 Tax=Actinomadura sp. OS1-43 TaxID=604315 RepID=UPI00255B1A31|nr:hypothetical protein [Actinomadura sp. OS1-43]MDL4813173.1 hypothetical protein [Actinomadura sp. OS1-43]
MLIVSDPGGGMAEVDRRAPRAGFPLSITMAGYGRAVRDRFRDAVVPLRQPDY